MPSLERFLDASIFSRVKRQHGDTAARGETTRERMKAFSTAKNGFELEYIPQITAQDFVELREHEGDHIAVLDVREPGEVSAGAIERSVRIPLGELQSRTGELDRNKLLVVHCKGGTRSAKAIAALKQAGFEGHLMNLKGGILAWSSDVDPSVPKY